MKQNKPQIPYTIEQVVEMDKKAEGKLELIGMELVNMGGGSPTHAYIGSNLTTFLNLKLLETNCRATGSDLAIKPPAAPKYRYADCVVHCGQSETVNFQGIQCLINPVLIVEVVSPTTKDFDNEDKFIEYKSFPALKEYLIVSQDKPHVIQYIKHTVTDWIRRDFIGIDTEIYLVSVNVTLLMKEVYFKVEFP
jgi:Uma2 family endonuclease